MSESDGAQAAMDRMFGIGEPRINVERPAYLDGSQPGRNAPYSRALLEARELFPDDGIAQHRYATRRAERVLLKRRK